MAPSQREDSEGSRILRDFGRRAQLDEGIVCVEGDIPVGRERPAGE